MPDADQDSRLTWGFSSFQYVFNCFWSFSVLRLSGSFRCVVRVAGYEEIEGREGVSSSG